MKKNRLVSTLFLLGVASSGFAQMNFTYINNFKPLGRCDDVAIADFNGDKKNDVVYSTGYVFLNKGGNPPAWEKVQGVFQESMGIWVGDLDNDKDMDIFAPQKEGAGYFVENVDGTGKNWIKHTIFSPPEELVEESRVVDINKDGKDDLIVLMRSSGPLMVLIQPSNPKSTWPSYVIGTAGGDEGTLDFGDIDGDGDTDLFVQGFWYQNDGNPEKNSWTKISHQGSAHKQRLADVNNDGKLDIIDGGTIYFGPSFSETVTMGNVPNSVYLHGLKPVDIDLDGDIDVVIGSFTSQETNPPVIIFENSDGKGKNWKRHAQQTEGAGHNLWVGDLNGDNYPDIVGKHYDSNKSGFDIWYNSLGTNTSIAKIKPMETYNKNHTNISIQYLLNGKSVPSTVKAHKRADSYILARTESNRLRPVLFAKKP